MERDATCDMIGSMWRLVTVICLLGCSEPLGGTACPPASLSMPCPTRIEPVTCPTTPPSCPQPELLVGPPPRVLIFTRQTTWMHPSNCVAAQNLAFCGMARGWNVTTTDDPSFFTADNLANYDVVVFSVTSGAVFDNDDQRMAFQSFIEHGKGFAGIHSASYTEIDWPWFRNLVGATFRDHPVPDMLPGELLIEDRHDVSTRLLPAPWVHCEELYTFTANPADNPNLHVLVSLNENCPAYPDNMRLGHHPLSWRQSYDGGRSFYSALGHHQAAYAEPEILTHLLAGIEWAAGAR